MEAAEAEQLIIGPKVGKTERVQQLTDVQRTYKPKKPVNAPNRAARTRVGIKREADLSLG